MARKISSSRRPELISRPKMKRRSRTHVPGGQLHEDIPTLHEHINLEAVQAIAAKVQSRIPKTQSLLGPGFSALVSLREALHNSVGWFRVRRNVERRPTPSELIERFKSVEDAIQRLWCALGLPGEAARASELMAHQFAPDAPLKSALRRAAMTRGHEVEPHRVAEMTVPDLVSTDTEILEAQIAFQGDFLRAQVPTTHYPDVKIFEAIQSLRELLAWTQMAKNEARANLRKATKRVPDEGLHLLTRDLADIYAEAFGVEPTETVNGPWLTFLAEVLSLAGEDHRTQEGLRQLWRKARPSAPR